MKKTNKMFSLIMAVLFMCLSMVCVSADNVIVDSTNIGIIWCGELLEEKENKETELMPMSSSDCPTCTTHSYGPPTSESIGYCSQCGGSVTETKRVCTVCKYSEISTKTNHNSTCRYYGKT